MLHKGSTENNDYFALAIPLVLTLAMQSLIGLSVMRLFQQEAKGKIWFLIIYIICVYFSIGFAFSHWFKVIGAERYAIAQFNYNRQTILDDFNKLAAGINSYVTNMKILADYSKQQEKDEIKNGNTCGYTTKKVDGPRSALRAQDARLFKSLNDSIEQYSPRINNLLQEVNKELKSFDASQLSRVQDAVNRAVSEASGLVKVMNNESLRKSLNDRLLAGRNQISILKEGSVTSSFYCPDPVLEAKINDVLKIELPVPQPIKMWDPNDPRSSIEYAFQEWSPASIWQAVKFIGSETQADLERQRRSLLRGEGKASESNNQYGNTTLFKIAFTIGLLCDVLIFILGFAIKYSVSLLDGIADSVQESCIADLDWEYLGFTDPKDLLRNLDRYVIAQTPWHYYLAVPHTFHEPNDEDKLYSLIGFLEIANAIVLTDVLVERDQAPGKEIPEYESFYSTGSYFKLYRLKGGLLQKLRRALLIEQYRLQTRQACSESSADRRKNPPDQQHESTQQAARPEFVGAT